MTDDSAGKRVGVPPQTTGATRGKAQRPHADASPRPARVGVPPQRVQGATEASEADIRRAEAHRAREAEAREREHMSVGDDEVFRLPRVLFHPMIVCLLVAVSGLLILYVYAQATALITQLQAAGPWSYRIGMAGLMALSGAVVVSIAALVIMYFRLSVNPSVRLHDLNRLAERRHLQQLARKQVDAARRKLESYLQAYPAEDAGTRVLLMRCGLGEEDLAGLSAERDRLREEATFGGTAEWIHEFATGFQATLDKAAQRRIKRAASRVGVQTAVSWLPLVDTLVVLYHGFAMCGDLCRIYSCRMGKSATAVFLARVFFQAYVAGRLDEFEGHVADEASDTITDLVVGAEEGGAEGAVEGIAGLTGKGAAKLGGGAIAKAGAGVLNYMLIRRLGRRCIDRLRPVRLD